MKIAIIGAGFTGLTAAYELSKKGHDVVVFEKGENPGGLAIGFKKPGWDWTLEEYYHHWFTNDDAMLHLAKEIDYPVVIKRPKTAMFIDNGIYQLDSPLTLLTFKKLKIHERIHMGIGLALLRFNPWWKPLEKITAAKVLPLLMGKAGYETIWQPQLKNKFGDYFPEVSLAWFWARIAKRTTSLAYPEGGFLQFSENLAAVCKEHGVKLQYNTTIENIKNKDGRFIIGKEIFDKIIVTLPAFAFMKLFPELPEEYKKKLAPLKGLGAMTIVLRLKKPFFKDNTYWLSVCDTKAPILAIVEHTNFMDKKYYNNESLVYLGNYLETTHPYYTMSPDKLLQEFDPYLRKINPEYKKSLIGFDVFRTPFAQPIIPTNYSRMIPDMETPIKNVYLANMQQVYPWDRGTNYAVELGQKIAEKINNDK